MQEAKPAHLNTNLKASTNHPYCPTLRTLVPDSVVPEGVTCVYEIVVNGLTLDAIKNALESRCYSSSRCSRSCKDFVRQLRRKTRSLQGLSKRCHRCTCSRTNTDTAQLSQKSKLPFFMSELLFDSF